MTKQFNPCVECGRHPNIIEMTASYHFEIIKDSAQLWLRCGCDTVFKRYSYAGGCYTNSIIHRLLVKTRKDWNKANPKEVNND